MPSQIITSTLSPFTLTSPLGTDIWRKPPNINIFTAPTHPFPLPKYPLQSFQRAGLSLTFPPATSLRQFDQAGLISHLTHQSSSKDKWIKTGIEFYEGKAWASTVGCDAWSDWSVVPLRLEKKDSRSSVTIEVQRKGVSLWVYWFVKDGDVEEKVPLRERNWVFADEEDWVVGVGGFVARETEGEGRDELQVEFGDGVEVGIWEGERG